jgi:hypothetical protein
MAQTLDLSRHEIDNEFAVRNAPPAPLYEDAVMHEHAAIADSGALIIRSGKKTGRSPLDKRIVDHVDSTRDIWWGPVNIKLDEQVFTEENSAKVTAFVADLQGVAQSLNNTMATFRAEDTGKQVAELVRQLSKTTENLNRLITDVYARRETIFGGVETTLRHLDETVSATRALVQTTQSQISGTGGSVGSLMSDLNATTTRLQETLDIIRSDPSVLFWGRKVPEREFKE